MKNKFQRSVNIIDSVLSYAHKIGAASFHVDFDFNQENSHITIEMPLDHISQERLDALNASLKLPRQHEVEENYWHLGADANSGDEISLVGMMVDQAEARFDNHKLTIQIVRSNT